MPDQHHLLNVVSDRNPATKNYNRNPTGKRGVRATAYTAEQLAFFATYREARADLQPPECQPGAGCWVEDGPPALCHTGCTKCQVWPIKWTARSVNHRFRR